jgi:U3 small nucleolar RNA-associated protein 5
MVSLAFQLLIKLTSVFYCEFSDTVNEGISEYNLDEPTMEEILETINLVNRNDENADTQEQSLSMAPPSADSVNILLKQALHADDNASLLNCLYNRDEKVFLLLVLLWLNDALNFISVITLQHLIFLNLLGS